MIELAETFSFVCLVAMQEQHGDSEKGTVNLDIHEIAAFNIDLSSFERLESVRNVSRCHVNDKAFINKTRRCCCHRDRFGAGEKNS